MNSHPTKPRKSHRYVSIDGPGEYPMDVNLMDALSNAENEGWPICVDFIDNSFALRCGELVQKVSIINSYCIADHRTVTIPLHR